jgi:hypothetical protein
MKRAATALTLFVAMPAAPQAVRDTVKRGREIASQPARDIGASETKIPPVLVSAAANPYSLGGIKTCRQINGAIDDLGGALGPDFTTGVEKKESKAEKLAESGGKTVVNAFIPFRGRDRGISGVASAQRRLNAAIDAGFARRSGAWPTRENAARDEVACWSRRYKAS